MTLQAKKGLANKSVEALVASLHRCVEEFVGDNTNSQIFDLATLPLRYVESLTSGGAVKDEVEGTDLTAHATGYAVDYLTGVITCGDGTDGFKPGAAAAVVVTYYAKKFTRRKSAAAVVVGAAEADLVAIMPVKGCDYVEILAQELDGQGATIRVYSAEKEAGAQHQVGSDQTLAASGKGRYLVSSPGNWLVVRAVRSGGTNASVTCSVVAKSN